MDLNAIFVVSDRLETVSAAEVAEAERELGCRFPIGYAEYVQRLGAGALDDLLRVFLPDQILEGLADWRDTKDEFWFWDDPKSATDKATVLATIPLADTENGDELCFHPGDPDTVIVLRRDQDRAHSVGSGLSGAIDWVFTSGELQRPGGPAAFEPYARRRYVRHQTERGANLAEVRDALLELGVHALVDQPDDHYAVVYVPAIKGRVKLMRLDTGEVDALIVHDDEVSPTSLDLIQGALERVGAPYQMAWG